jgi:diguanylate cyclase (GGDEF)-like protein
MPRVPRQVWLVSLVLAAIAIMAAVFYAAVPVSPPPLSQAIGPGAVAIGPREMAGWAALVISGLLLQVYLYRRRLFILFWTGGWAVTGISMLMASREYAPAKLGWLIYGFSQFFGIVAALLFVLSADAYRTRPRFRLEYVYILVPMMLWFGLAPTMLQAAPVFTPGHLLIAGALVAAAVGHFQLLRQAQMLGAALTAVGLLALGGVNAWTALTIQAPDADGATQFLILSVVPYLVIAAGMQLMTFEDMSDDLGLTNRKLEHAQEKLRRLVITDSLTGCRNRRFFDEIIGRELQRHRRSALPLSVLFVDIDRFKSINDTYGHDAGDEVLKQVAAFLQANIREADYVFRWGGDEFLVLISCSEAEARRRGEAIELGFTNSTDARAMPAEVRLSIGCAEVRGDSEDVMAQLKIADGRMYESKRLAAI